MSETSTPGTEGSNEEKPAISDSLIRMLMAGIMSGRETTATHIIDKSTKEHLIMSLSKLNNNNNRNAYKKWKIKCPDEIVDLTDISTMDDDEIDNLFLSCLGGQEIGCYVLNPSLWHKASSKFFADKFPHNNLLVKNMQEEIPFYDWDFALKALARANNYDVTAHADIGGAEIDPCVAMENACEKYGININNISKSSYKNADLLILDFINNNSVCFGGILKVDECKNKMGLSALIAYTAAVSAHEQNANGDWEQVHRNIYAATGDLRCIFYGIAGFLLVNDFSSVYSYANMICQCVNNTLDIDNDIEITLLNGKTVILEDIIKEYIGTDGSIYRLKFLTNLMKDCDPDTNIIDMFANHMDQLNRELPDDDQSV